MAESIKQSNLNKSRLDKFILAFSVPACLKNIASRDERGKEHKSHTRVIPDDLQYSIYGAIVPEIEIPSISLPQFGQHLKVSSHRRSDYTDVTVNFTIDNEFNNYWYIFRWLDILNDQRTAIYDEHSSGTAKEYPHPTNQEGTAFGSESDEPFLTDESRQKYFANHSTNLNPDVLRDYSTDFSLYGLNEYNKKIVQFDYKTAFPTTLGEINYDYQDAAEISSSFTFSFSQLQVVLL